MRHGLAVLEASLGVGERRRRLALRLVRRRGGQRVVLVLCGGQRVGGHDEPPDPGAHLVEDVRPGALALAAEGGHLLLVHLEVAGEAELLGEQPADAPVPPPLERAARGAGERGERRRGPGPPEGPLGGGGGDGLDLAREGGQPLPQAHEVALLLAAAALEGGQVVFERPGRQEPRLLDVLQDGGHAARDANQANRKEEKKEVSGLRCKRNGLLQISSSSSSFCGLAKTEEEESQKNACVYVVVLRRELTFRPRGRSCVWTTGWFLFTHRHRGPRSVQLKPEPKRLCR